MANPTIQGTFTVMHISTNANFDLYTYGAYVIIDNASGPFTINGEVIDVPNAVSYTHLTLPTIYSV